MRISDSLKIAQKLSRSLYILEAFDAIYLNNNKNSHYIENILFRYKTKNLRLGFMIFYDKILIK